jgi:RTX calcium-binding nonapeptide repeat (4 copies)
MRLAACVLALLAAAPAAEAGELTFRTVEVAGPRGERSTGQVATYVAAPGERNRVEVRFADARLVVRDAAGVRSGSGCQAVDGGVTCPVFALRSLEVGLGDGDDQFAADPLRVDVDGGEGDDRLAGSGRLAGGLGADELRSAGGSATLAGGPGPDLLDPSGGGGLDYSERTEGVSVNLAGDAAAGEPGEGDRVLPGATRFYGGAGPDVAIAAPAGADMHGGAGDDRLTGSRSEGNSALGGTGDDVLSGGRAYDRLEGGRGNDVVVGRGGDDELFADEVASPEPSVRDVLRAGTGEDYLLGGAGPDTLDGGPGRDRLIGAGGVDRLLARDRSADSVLCGDLFDDVPSPGHDLAVLDRRDEQRGCGRVQRSGPRTAELLGAVDVHSARRRDSAVVHVYVGCPEGRPACSVTIRPTLTPRRLPKCSLRVPAGARRRVRIAIPSLPSPDFSLRLELAPAPAGREPLTLDSIWRTLRRQAQPGGGLIRANPARCR